MMRIYCIRFYFLSERRRKKTYDKNMSFSVENLISEIFCHSVLWDQKSKNYHNRIIVEKNWTEIEKALETPSK